MDNAMGTFRFMKKITRREMLATSAMATGAVAAGGLFAGCEREFVKNEKMLYRPLGKTGLEVSVIGFGSEWMVRNTQETCTAVTRRCEEGGVNIIDVWMSDPAVRTRIGRALKGHRRQWIIQGHIGCAWTDGQHENTRDVPRCRAAFEDLLSRLGTDFVDIGMIHNVDNVEHWNEVIRSPYYAYVRELLAQGKIRHVGLSTHHPLVAIEAVKSGLVEVLMFSVNPAYDILPPIEEFMSFYKGDERYEPQLGGIAPERGELYRLCEEHGVGLTVMKAYAGGRLFDPQRSPFRVALTPVQCIHYALTRPGACCVLPGYDTVGHVEDALHYCQATAAEKDYASVLAKAPRHAYDGQCTYCGHCSPCSSGIDIAMVQKYYDLAVLQPTVPDSVKRHYLALEHHASECIGCRRCERRCPFHVKISARMKLAAKLFGI